MLYRIVTCLLVLSLPPAAYADEASVFDYWLGDHIIDYPLSELDVITTDLDSFEGQSFIRVRAPNSNEVVLTFRRPRNTLQYIEHNEFFKLLDRLQTTTKEVCRKGWVLYFALSHG